MPSASKQVFTLVCTTTRQRRPIEFRQDYGAVAPGLWTTNGSIPYVARLCADYVTAGRVTVEGSHLPSGLDFTDRVALCQALRDAYLDWNASLPSPPTGEINDAQVHSTPRAKDLG